MDYNDRMKGQQRRFTQQYNEAVIRLIKYKFQPLKYSKTNQRHQYDLTHTIKQTKSCHVTPQVSLPSLPSTVKQPSTLKSESQYVLLKAKDFIKNQRREDRSSYRENLQLKEYIQLFEKPIGVKQKGKRDSIELSLLQSDTRQRLEPLATISKVNEQIRFNEEQISIMNAKIRRKMNHKKMIDLAKRA